MREQRLIAAIVATVGAASLGAEIAAARLLAPWFGASTIVWANTIATVLVALSAGYWLGGRLADRDASLAGLGRLVLLAAGLMAVVPFVAGPFLRVSVDALDSVEAGAFAGSLIAVLVLIAVPVLVLGATAPYAIRLTVRTVDEAGRVAGRLYAISTLGSLAGVFLSALLLIPLVGTRRTFLAFALALAVVAVPALGRRAALGPVVLLALALVPVGTIKTAGAARVLWERETQYQYARVVQDPDGERRMELNEGQAVHSRWRPGTYLTDDYWDEALVLPALAGRAPRSIAILGNAGGTVARAYGHYFPAARVDAVEIDGELTAAGRRWFGLGGPRLQVHTADARPYLRAAKRRWDVILVDAYRQPYIPFYLATREFFDLVRDRLVPGGMVLVNVGHPEESDRLERVLTATIADVFGVVSRDPVTPTNVMLMAARPGGAAGGALGAVSLPADLRPVAQAAVGRLAPGLRGGAVYTDDRAPVEWLIDSSILKVAAEGHR